MSPVDDLFQTTIKGISESYTLEQRCRALELEHRYHLSVIKDLRFHLIALKRENDRLRHQLDQAPLQ